MDTDELRTELEALIQPRPTTDRDALRRVRDRAARRRRASRASTVVVVAAVLLVGGIVTRSAVDAADDIGLDVVGNPPGTAADPAPPGPTTSITPPPDTPSLPTTPTSVPVAEDEQLVPATVPAGFTLVERRGLGPGSGGMGASGSPEVDRVQRWVRFDAERRHPEATFDVMWLATDAGDMERRSHLTGAPITVRGRPGFATPGVDGIAWEEPTGRVVTVYSSQLALPDLLTIADSLQARSDGGFTVGAPPDGFELAAESPGWMSTGANIRAVTYQDGARAFDITIADGSDKTPAIRFSDLRNELVEIRGHEGVVGPQAFGYASTIPLLTGTQPDLFLDWEEGGSLISMVSVGMTPEELVAIARDLVPVPVSSLGG